jgi:Flp pilus assembly pilin Flp
MTAKPDFTSRADKETHMRKIRETCSSEGGQGIAEYAAMLALILILVLGTVQLIGGHTKNVFSRVASELQPQSDGD